MIKIKKDQFDEKYVDVPIDSFNVKVYLDESDNDRTISIQRLNILIDTKLERIDLGDTVLNHMDIDRVETISDEEVAEITKERTRIEKIEKEEALEILGVHPVVVFDEADPNDPFWDE